MNESFNFTFSEILALLGVAQCSYVLVYMLFRSGRLSRGTVPALYFTVLGLAFLSDAAQRLWFGYIEGYAQFQWLFWFLGPPLSFLLIIQIARITSLPALKNYLVLLILPIAYAASYFLTGVEGACSDFLTCQEAKEWLVLSGAVAGALSLLAIWLKRGMLDGLHARKGGQERFWLIIALIVLNVVFLADMMALSWGWITEGQNQIIRVCVGIAFVYTASTSLLRIYPQAMRVENEDEEEDVLTDKEIDLAMVVEKLVYYENVYQEASYGRKEMAQELDISESALSRIVNLYFGKSVPQLLNEARVVDSKSLLEQTDVAIRIVAEESGFNSLASFNRVFKEITGVTPSEFRNQKAA